RGRALWGWARRSARRRLASVLPDLGPRPVMTHRFRSLLPPFALMLLVAGLRPGSAALAQAPSPSADQSIAGHYRDAADRLIDAALADSTAYQRLRRLGGTIRQPPRRSCHHRPGD